MRRLFYPVMLTAGLWLSQPVLAMQIHQHEHEHKAAASHTAHPDLSEAENDNQQHDHSAENKSVSLTPEQISYADITIEPLQARAPDSKLWVAGEVMKNGYTSYAVSPRVDSVVLKRHVSLGEHVSEGQPLVTLFSETVAAAQASYVDSHSEWLRIRNIGPGSVSDKRIKESQTAYHAAVARLRAYGLDTETIRALSVNSRDLGEYTLRAVTHGTVLADDFNQGQQIQSGEQIMHIADETQLWVEARLSPGNRTELPAGQLATVLFAGERFAASVAQEAHTIDPVTRTRVVRLLVDNQSHRLHPGMFVEVVLSQPGGKQLLVPETALVRHPAGQWQVFVQTKPGLFTATEVERLDRHGQLVSIRGVEAGMDIAVTGAFFIASQIAKGGFDPHNH